MMVTFVSQCEKNALKKTRRVLDAFADRIGDNTWQTLITEDGLLTVKKMLRQTASKSTAVSCHWIRSRSRSQFLWVVGNRHKFNERGVVPVNTTSKLLELEESFSINTEVIALLSRLAGLFHDVGKAMALFQEKLKPEFSGKAYEPYRHEWVSLRIFQAFVDQSDDKLWLEELANIDNTAESRTLNKLDVLKDGIANNPINPFKTLPPVAKLVAWLIVSHHKLPQYPRNGDNPPTFENMDIWLNTKFEACWNSSQCLNDDWSKSVIADNWSFPVGTPLKSAHWQTQASIVAKKMLRCDRMFEQDWFDQHFTAHLARLSLMLSDHYYSSKKETSPEFQDRNYHAYANTDKDENGHKYRKQKLDEHNIVVGINAYDIAKSLPFLKNQLPPLKPNKAFTDKVPKEYQQDFGWQDSAYSLATAVNEDSKKFGFFGVCMASTGKGKTRGNARIMYGLSDEGECRFSIALGLRTLTLQTGDALKKDLDLKDDELALLIGSQAVKDLHQQTRITVSSAQENDGSESAEPLLKDEMELVAGLSEYTGDLAKWFEHDPKILKLIQTPVLVSTIDYLMPANEGIRGGRQIAPMLRLLTSDLVLDEPDDFGLDDLPALCRLVNWAGMLGSRVLLSTATISPSLANALFAAYQAGRKQYTQVNGEQGENTKVCCAWFDEFNKPQSLLIDDSASYKKAHNQFVDKRIENIKKKTKPLRKAEIINVASELGSNKTPSALMANLIRQSIDDLHKQHAIKVNNKSVSIGLVRMANIDPLIQVAKHLLTTKAPDNTVIHYCIYHSQFPLVQRSSIEYQLDMALSRKSESDWLKNSGIPETVEDYSENNHIFVVIATPVAEVGRDHDYDWAVIEPSSMRSIIQLAGRVQRHRKCVPSSANIHILSKNYKGLKGVAPCFEKPGFEKSDFRYSSKNIEDLTNASEFDEINAIPRIKVPQMTPASFTKEDKKKVSSFNLLEHLAQELRLYGGNNEQNHAAQWWQSEITWCGELQRLQPFRASQPEDDFSLFFSSRTGKFVWQEKVPKTFPPEYIATTAITKRAEHFTLENRVVFWGAFDLLKEIKKMVTHTGVNEEYSMRLFTHISLRKLDQNTAEQWQCHPQLGIYKLLKKDGYKHEG
jgi:CRISPR-associated endonuclease/helicase Cas3